MTNWIVNHKFLFSLICLAIAALFFWAFYFGPVVRRYTVSTSKIPVGKQVQIVLITDLHSCFYGRDQEQLLALIQAQAPDIILMSGDIVDDYRSDKGIEALLKGLQDTVPICYAIGNHECRTGDLPHVRALMHRYGVMVLNQETERFAINGVLFTVSGIDDPESPEFSEPGSWPEKAVSVFSKLADDPTFHILLSHRPEQVDTYDALPFDLVLAGHAHGGQVRIPGLLNGLYAPGQGFFPKYAGGRYDFPGYSLIVSRGLSRYLVMPRVFNPPELVVITLEGTGSPNEA